MTHTCCFAGRVELTIRRGQTDNTQTRYYSRLPQVRAGEDIAIDEKDFQPGSLAGRPQNRLLRGANLSAKKPNHLIGLISIGLARLGAGVRKALTVAGWPTDAGWRPRCDLRAGLLGSASLSISNTADKDYLV